MRPFRYTQANDAGAAVRTVVANANSQFLAGGTNLIDLMKEDVARPVELVDITRLTLTQIRTVAGSGNLSLGALAKNADTANHPLVRQNYPLLTQAILAGASGQIRNMATNGGNLNQRTRCPYFYDTAMPCNKREPNSGCGALESINRNHALFGWSKECIATHPSDMAVAVAALDAIVHVQKADGTQRRIPFADYHRLPGDNPERDNTLTHGELITAIELPKNNFADKSYYLKVRDRSSYAFALVSIAAALETDGNQIKQVRLAMGGVAHKPWRALEAEKFLTGKAATEANFKSAADAEMKNAKPLEHNKFKVELGRRAIVRALTQAMNGGTNA
ncbi:xanthine dehydrogenase family protein subunit M [Chroococcidiopsis sp. FACHB-1243]|uniref:FAD binding domain-containing protein n=1 Tax=Chroococcidiopsis sp. [FACHB-1243] TaxID=2692781 RepID=UPI001785472F|nr:xanthine dehydrogenase family protein subunit M [Chroococcidiopsis sp. [FACHB-1243]]MBD2309687.1 xanthine dehydrogenase family protein subunit M [Chroococcidiopsis sp. [FACHB-1243]]